MDTYDAAEHDGTTEPHVPRKKPKKPQPQRHQWFDAWKVAKGSGLKALVENTVAFMRHHEHHNKVRARARKAVDEALHLKRIEAVVCNLAHAALMPPPTGRIAVKLGNGPRAARAMTAQC